MSKSKIPHLELDDKKDLLLYAMKIVPGDYTNVVEDYYSKRRDRSKVSTKKRSGRKTRKKRKKSKRKKKKKYGKKHRNIDKKSSQKGSASSSFLPVVVLNSDTKSNKDSRVSKSDPKRTKYWSKRRHGPKRYDRDYYDDYFYDYPPPYSSSWYKHRRPLPRLRPRYGYGMESSTSEDHYSFADSESREKKRDNVRYIYLIIIRCHLLIYYLPCFGFLYYNSYLFRSQEKPILQNFYFRNPDDNKETTKKNKQHKSSSNPLESIFGSGSSQPYGSVASIDDSL